MIKTKDETEDEMQTITIIKKQYISKLFVKRIDKVTREYQFID